MLPCTFVDRSNPVISCTCYVSALRKIQTLEFLLFCTDSESHSDTGVAFLHQKTGISSEQQGESGPKSSFKFEQGFAHTP